ncbi:MAG: 50S ribosomal protein L30 [Christensenellaceae bacterium]
MADKKQIKITLIRSTIGCLQYQKDTVSALGLKKINQFKIHEETPAILGMVAKVAHLVKVESL